jgi:hypothetical protein
VVPDVMLGSLVHPVKEYCLHAWFQALRGIENQLSKVTIVDTSGEIDFSTYPTKDNYSIRRVSNPNMFSRIALGRQTILESFLSSECNYLFFLECDLFIQEEVLPTLINRDKPVVGVPYIMGYLRDKETRLKKDYLTSALNFDRRLSMTMTELTSDAEGDLVEVNEMGFGCLVLQRDICKTIYENFRIPDKDCDDSILYEILRDHDVKRWADISQLRQVRHYPHFHMDYATFDRYLEKHGS